MVTLIYKISPLDVECVTRTYPQGMSIRQMASEEGIHKSFVNKVWSSNASDLLAEDWADHIPKEDETIVMALVPQKKVLKSVAPLLISLAIPGFGKFLAKSPLFGKFTGNLVASYLGGMLINSLIKPPVVPPTPAREVGEEVYSVGATRNSINTDAPIPYLMGKRKITPPYAARPYTLNEGNDQILHALFAVAGYNTPDEIKLSDFKIGDIEIDKYPNTKIKFDKPYTEWTTAEKDFWYPNYVQEDKNLPVDKLDSNDDPTSVALITEPDCTGFDIDFSFPQGLFFQNDNGSNSNVEVQYKISYRPKLQGGETVEPDWLVLPSNSGHTASALTSPDTLFTNAKTHQFNGYVWAVGDSGQLQVFNAGGTPNSGWSTTWDYKIKATGVWQSPLGVDDVHGDFSRWVSQGMVGYLDIGTYAGAITDKEASIVIPPIPNGEIANPNHIDSYAGSTGDHGIIVGTTAGNFYTLSFSSDVSFNLSLNWTQITLTNPSGRTGSFYDPLVTDFMTVHTVEYTEVGAVAGYIKMLIFKGTDEQRYVVKLISATGVLAPYLANVTHQNIWAIVGSGGDATTKATLSVPGKQIVVVHNAHVYVPEGVRIQANTITAREYDPVSQSLQIIFDEDTAGVILDSSDKEVAVLEDRRLDPSGFLLVLRDTQKVYRVEASQTIPTIDEVTTIGLINASDQGLGLFYDVNGETVVYDGIATYAVDSANAGIQTINDKSIGMLRVGRGIKGLTPNQWEIKVERLTVDHTENARYRDRLYVENIKSKISGEVISPDVKVATIALKIKATDQLNGALEDFNCVASRKVPTRVPSEIIAAVNKATNSSISFIDTSDSNNLTLVNQLFFHSTTVNQIITDTVSSTAYVATNAKVSSYSIGDISAGEITFLTSELSEPVNELILAEDGTILIVRTNTHVRTYDVSNPSSWIARTSLATAGVQRITYNAELAQLYVVRRDLVATNTYDCNIAMFNVLANGDLSFIAATPVRWYQYVTDGSAQDYTPAIGFKTLEDDIVLISSAQTSNPTDCFSHSLTLDGSTISTFSGPAFTIADNFTAHTLLDIGRTSEDDNHWFAVVGGNTGVGFTNAVRFLELSSTGEPLSVISSNNAIQNQFQQSDAFINNEGYLVATATDLDNNQLDSVNTYDFSDLNNLKLKDSYSKAGYDFSRTSKSTSASTSWQPNETSNPAWYYVDIMTGYASKTPLSRDTNFNVSSLEEFARENNRLGYGVNQYITKHTTPSQLLETTLATARASWAVKNGQYDVVQDKIQDVPKGFFSPRNMKKGSFGRDITYMELPHAFKVTFFDEDNNYQKTVRIVYDDAYSLTGSEVGKERATRFEDLSFIGVTSSAQVQSLSRYQLAQMKLRPYTDSFNIDLAFLGLHRGDLLCYQHDEVLLGTGDGRITNISGDEFTIDDKVLAITGTPYKAQAIKWDGSALNLEIELPLGASDGLNSTFKVTNGVDISTLDRGIQVLFWDYTVGVNYGVITSIVPNADLTAQVTVQPYHEGIIKAAEGELIPDYTPTTVTDPDIIKGKPIAPVIINVITDESVMYRSIEGSLKPRIVLNLAPGNSDRNINGPVAVSASMMQARVRLSSSPGSKWIASKVEHIGFSIGVEDVEIGESYYVQARNLSAAGEVSEWADFGAPDAVVVIGNSSPPLDLVGYGVDQPLSDNSFRFYWDAPIIPDFANAELRRTTTGQDWDNSTFLVRSKTTEARVSFLGTGERWIYAKSIDTAQNESVNASVHKMDILSPEAFNFSGNAVGNKAVLTFDNKSGSEFIPGTGVTEYYLPIREYEVYRGELFDEAVIVDITTTHSALVEELASGTFKYWVVAIDVAGNRQSNPPFVEVQVANNPNVLYITTFTDVGFLNPSASENYIVLDTGEVLIPFSTGETWEDQYSPTEVWEDPVNAGFPYMGQTSDVTGYYEHEFDYGDVIASANLTLSYSYNTTGGNPAIIPTMFYKKLPGDAWTSGGESKTGVVATDFQYVKVRIEVRANGAGGWVDFQGGSISIDVAADRFTESNNVECDAGDVSGTWIAYAADFVKAEKPLLTYQGQGNVSLAADQADENGFYLFAFNPATNTRISITNPDSVMYRVDGIL